MIHLGVLALYLPEVVLVCVVVLKIIDGLIHGSSTCQINQEPLGKLLDRDYCHPVFSYFPCECLRVKYVIRERVSCDNFKQ